MSSHHFVKEGQEPALIIVDAVSYELAAPILEWAPQVIILDTAIDEVLLWGIKIDVIILHPDQFENIATKLDGQGPLKTILTDPKEAVQKALTYLIDTNQKAAAIMINDPAFLFNQYDDLTKTLSITLITPTLKWSGITSGKYKKWFSSGSRLVIKGKPDLPLPQNLIKHEDSYETMADGMLELTSNSPFWVGEPL